MDPELHAQARQQDIARHDGHPRHNAGTGSRDAGGPGGPRISKLDQVDHGTRDRLAAHEPARPSLKRSSLSGRSAGHTGSYRAERIDGDNWADDLAIKTSATVPADTWLPAPISPTLLANLSALAVTSLNGSTVTINSGTAAPNGGGFEIRRRDFAFMPGEDPDLVMRGSQPNLTFSRTSASERYYIRMYDGASPPNYSEFSAAVFINLPLGS
jgi:hypothetical protein